MNEGSHNKTFKNISVDEAMFLKAPSNHAPH